jgi:uncharacterized repeat protein (TIGR01451 family)
MNSRYALIVLSIAMAVLSLAFIMTVVGGIASSMSDEATVIVSGVDIRDGMDNRLLLSQRQNISQDGGQTLTEPDSYYLPLIEFDNISPSLARTALIVSDNSTNNKNQGIITYVDIANTGFEDGTQAHPFNTIQEAIDYASDGNTIVVFPGTYVENLTIQGKRVNLRSKLGPQMTVIDGSARKSVIQIFEESSPTDVVIDGFTIRNGGGSSGSSGDGFGVLMAMSLGSSGMGILATIQNNIITGNNLRGGIGIISSTMSEHIEISIINNRIIENSARDAGGAGIVVDAPEPTGFINVENNVIANNAGYSGGGLRLVTDDSNFMINVLNNTIYSNTAEYGGGIASNASNVSLINNIFFLNSAQQEGNDLYLVQAGLSANVSFNIIGGGQFAGINGNISSDPLLINPISGDFHLKVDSPAIDAGTMVPVTRDFDEESRPYDGDRTGGAQWDIGVDEYYPPLWYSLKTANTSSALPGEVLTYTISLLNNGVIPVDNVYITDTLPVSLTYINNSLTATSGSFKEQGNIISWTGSVSVSQGVTLTFGTTISTTIPFGSVITNTATISDTSSKFERGVPIRVATDLCLPLVPRAFCSPYTDNFNNPASGWPVTDDGNVRLEYLDGEYRILVRSINWGAAARPGFQASDYSVSVDLRNPNEVIGSYGIGFGISSDWSTFYTLEIYPDGWYGIYRYDPNDVVTLSEAYSSAIYQGSASNQIKVERYGASINAYANGQLLASVTDGTYTGFLYLGLAVFSYDQPNMDILFDNFAVYPVSCGGLNSLTNLAGGWLPSSGQENLNFNSIEIGHSRPKR